jgi:hypothetical protein
MKSSPKFALEMTTGIAKGHVAPPSFMLDAMTRTKIAARTATPKSMAAIDDASVIENFQDFKWACTTMRRAVARPVNMKKSK